MFFTKMILAVAALGLAAGLSIHGAAATEEGAKEPAKAGEDVGELDGTWEVTAHDTLGRPASKEFLAQEHQWVFVKDGVTMKSKGDVGRKGTFRFDPKQDPKTLDITLEPGLQPGPKAKVPGKEVLSCIYALDGDTLKVCYGYSQVRPTAFESKANPGTGLVVLHRQPAAEEKPGKD